MNLPSRLVGVCLALTIFSACGSDDTGPICVASECDGVCVANECIATGDGGVDALPDIATDIPLVRDTPEEASDFAVQCERNTDCRSGYCVDTADGRACSVFCTDACPEPDWTCRVVENSGGDVVSICLPDAAVLCRPCGTDSECGGLDDLCLELADGDFCGRECDGTDPCPDGYRCDEVSIGAELAQQCVPEVGGCGDCIDRDGDGRGEGDGCVAGDCDDLDSRVFEGAPELCDGDDNDCDEEVDEGIEFETDEANCGGCGVVCAPDNGSGECIDAACVVVGCDDGFFDDDGSAANGCEYACEPSGEELCDDEDNDCDGETDEDIDLLGDPANCGACGTICEVDGASAICVAGECGLGDCDDGLANCNGFVEDGCETVLASDAEHCGVCENLCAFDNASASCSGGSCQIGDCAEGFDDCDTLRSTGCETNLLTDLEHCGACRSLCEFATTAAVCEAGLCEPSLCEGGLLDCDDDLETNGCEVDPTGDGLNCGGCGIECAFVNAAATCDESRCEMGDCEGPFRDCANGPADGCETDTDTSVVNCGSCGRTCAFPNAEASCGEGECVMGACLDGWADCINGDTDGCETRIESDPGNCGGCGDLCEFDNAQGICSGGDCSMGACVLGRADCNEDDVDGCERNLVDDALHCGACENACDDTNATAICEDRACSIDECDEGFDDCNGAAFDGCEVELESDDLHCGECRNSCVASGGDAVCIAGDCEVLECDAGFGDCDGRYDTGCEVPLVASLGHCGECFNVCSYDNGFAACRFAECEFLACDTGWGDCNDDVDIDGCETDLDTSLDHCGVCGLQCDIAGANEVCSGGVCTFTGCEENRDGCVDGPENGCETDLLIDPDHCGVCDTSCDLDFTLTGCAAGECEVLGCIEGYENCDDGIDGCDTNVVADPSNCGDCGIVCAADNATTGCDVDGCFIASCTGGYTDDDGLYSTGCEEPPDGGGPDRSGTFSLTPTISYSCVDLIFGSTVISLNETSWPFSYSGSMAVALSRTVMQQTPVPSGDDFAVSGIVAGDCLETYQLVGTFSDDDNWTGTLSLTLSGATCGFTNCANQTWPVSGARVP